jgi:hypothetical protein
MPSNNQRFNKKSQSSILGRLIDESIGEASNILNALDFVESPEGFNLTLSPLQRLCVRCFFGISFDYKPEMPGYDKAEVRDKFNDNVLYSFNNEQELLHYFYEEGRCNLGDWRDIPTGGFNEAALFAGRRGGKSELVAAIGGYALYKLLNIRSPQEYYGLMPGSPIDFTFMAADEEGSNRLYDKLKERINHSPFFSPYIRDNGSKMTFVSEADRGKRDITPTITVSSFPCTTNALRGPSSLFLALDEFAHFRPTKDTSSDKIYEAATPATMRFLANGRGRRESMILSISSPWQRIGKMYELHKLAMDKGPKSGIFTLRCSTTEMYPYADKEYLHQKYETSQMTWKAEYGGEFLDSSETYVKGVDLDICVDPERTNTVRFTPKVLGYQYFWGLDLGMEHDGTGLAIGHLEFNDQVGIELVYDYIDRMMVGEAFSGPGVENIVLPGEKGKYVNYTALPLTDILLWLKAMHDILPCFKGTTDQHGGAMLEQLLQINGITGMELVHLTPAINSEMYYALKGYIDNKRCRFPKVDKFIHEIKQVEAQVVAKYQLRVKAPEEKGSHDDMCDAVALVAWQAMNYLQTDGKLMLDPTGMSFAMQERMSRPPANIGDISNISMRDLKMIERESQIRQNTPLPGYEIVRSPWHKRGR